MQREAEYSVIQDLIGPYKRQRPYPSAHPVDTSRHESLQSEARHLPRLGSDEPAEPGVCVLGSTETSAEETSHTQGPSCLERTVLL